MSRWNLALVLAVVLAGCAPAVAPVPTATSRSASTSTSLAPTRTPTTVPTFTPQLAAAPPPASTANPLLERYLVGVESLLRHSAKVLSGQAVGVDGACESRYIIAFPYLEPDRSGGMTLAVTALERAPDGTVLEGTHTKLWNIRDEGLYPFQWKRILLFDRSEPGQIQIEYLAQGLEDLAWYIGLTMGDCSGDQLRMTAWFPVSSPSAVLLFTRYTPDAPLDLWLNDSGRLEYYRWEPWSGTLLWTLDPAPGKLLTAEWSQDSSDLNGDDIPDLVLTWEIDGATVRLGYSRSTDGFIPLGAAPD